jgi:subtilisin family serine protease
VILLALSATGCGGDSEATGWIPRDGAISGTITLLGNPFPTAPAARAAQVAAAGTPLDFPRTVTLPKSIPFSYRSFVRSGSAPSIKSNELIVTFRPAPLAAARLGSAAFRSSAYAQQMSRAIRARLLTMLPADAAVGGVSPAILTARIRVADHSRMDAVAAQLRRDPGVASVAPNHLVWSDASRFSRADAAATARTVPNNPFYVYQSWNYGLIDLPRAWTVNTGSPTVLVAVVDDGIRFDHPGIAANLTTDGYDFVTADTLPLCAGGTIINGDDGDGYDDDPTDPSTYFLDQAGDCFRPGDLGNHGLHVAGTIGAVGNNGLGGTGVNWHVHIRPVRVLGATGLGNSYDVAQGVLYAAGLPADNGTGGIVQASTGAKNINLSLGGPEPDTTLERSVESATQAGALVIAAAGNEGSAALHYPAGYPDVLAVAAVGPDGEPTAYSNFGAWVGIRAPGGDFDDAPNNPFLIPTYGILSTMWDFSTNEPVYAWVDGTSMATPHVAGVAALVLAQSPGLTPAQLRSRLVDYATGGATAYGAGLVNAYNSVTQQHGPPAKLFARIYGATDGELVETVEAQSDRTFQFNNIRDGIYDVYAGTDLGGDETLGTAGTLWGAYGSIVNPVSVTVFGSAPTAASFSVTFPEASDNHFLDTAAKLAIGGYMRGHIADTLTLDVYRIQIPKQGTYTFETSGWVGECGIALEEATAVGIFNASGNLITYAGFIDATKDKLCSRLTVSVGPGTYYIGVAGSFGQRYQLAARAGP